MTPPPRAACTSRALARLHRLFDVVGEQTPQKLVHARATQVDHAHMRDVEHAGVPAHGVVLLDLGAVVDRHVPAAEIHHARARGNVGRIERRALTHWNHSLRQK
jgi:hypothetical protein